MITYTEPSVHKHTTYEAAAAAAATSSGETSESHRHHQPGGRKSLQIQFAWSTCQQPTVMYEHQPLKANQFTVLSACLQGKLPGKAAICLQLNAASFVNSVRLRFTSASSFHPGRIIDGRKKGACGVRYNRSESHKMFSCRVKLPTTFAIDADLFDVILL